MYSYEELIAMRKAKAMRHSFMARGFVTLSWDSDPKATTQYSLATTKISQQCNKDLCESRFRSYIEAGRRVSWMNRSVDNMTI